LPSLSWLGFCCWLANDYLKTSHRLIYATGTKDKAFFNATWKMSLEEVERANNTSLKESDNEYLLFFEPDFLDKKRFSFFNQNEVTLWGHATHVEYSFFDSQLFEYYIPINIPINIDDPNPDRGFNEIKSTLDEVLPKIRTGT
jgi:hypothetical protein